MGAECKNAAAELTTLKSNITQPASDMQLTKLEEEEQEDEEEERRCLLMKMALEIFFCPSCHLEL